MRTHKVNAILHISWGYADAFLEIVAQPFLEFVCIVPDLSNRRTTWCARGCTSVRTVNRHERLSQPLSFLEINKLCFHPYAERAFCGRNRHGRRVGCSVVLRGVLDISGRSREMFDHLGYSGVVRYSSTAYRRSLRLNIRRSFHPVPKKTSAAPYLIKSNLFALQRLFLQ